MSQSLRSPSGIAIRAVAAASLFASKPKTAEDDKSAKNDKERADAQKLKIRAGLKPQPKR
jgi:hypothetical protein